MDRSRLYNKSIREAYEHLVSGSGRNASTEKEVWNDGPKSDQRNEDERPNDNASEFSIDDPQPDIVTGYKEDEDYARFKKSIVEDIEFMGDDDGNDDDDGDTEYTEEADKSFVLDNEEEEEDYYDDSEYYDRQDGYDSDYDERRWHENGVRGLLYTRSRSIWMVLGTLIIGWLLIPWISVHAVSPLTPDLNVKIYNLQNQLNQLVMERDQQKKHYQSDMDQNINLIIKQFENSIKRILPKNIKELSLVQSTIEKLENKVDSLGERVAWQNVNETLNRLNEVLPSELPVIINSNQSSEGILGNESVLLIPELHRYLAELIPSLINESVDVESILSRSNFKYDLNDYVKEILNDQFQFIERTQFIQELQSHMQAIREDVSREIKDKTSQIQTPKQISTIVLKRMIHNIYNVNQHQWESNLNKATFAQGTKLLNHLCSKTIRGTTGPLDLLQDCSYGCSTSTYWQCDPKKCQWAIRFGEPIFLTKISYLHGRFSQNFETMWAAPKIISIYAKPMNPLPKGTTPGSLPGDSSYVKLGQLNYDIFSKAIKQDFLFPDWFIQSKSLIRSLVFTVEENHGNSEFTSLRKFIVNGVTPKDLRLMSTFPSDWNQLVPEYAISLEEQEKSRLSKIAKWQDQQVPSFGDDELVS